jgi:hypothetical protein
MKTYVATILHVDLYVCETCSFTVRKEHTLEVFKENIWTLQGGEWRKVYSENFIILLFHTMFGWPVKENEIGRSYIARAKDVYKILVWKTKRNQLCGIHRHRWEDNNCRILLNVLCTVYKKK